jgi:hypothetical protein
VYGLATLRLEDLVPGRDPWERSSDLLELGWAGRLPVSVPREAPEALLPGLLHSLAEDRPLIFEASARVETAVPEWTIAPGERLVVARSGSALAVPAAFYASAMGRRFLHLESLAGLEERLAPWDPGSLILVDDFGRLGKPFLESFLAWSLARPPAPLSFGVLAARSAAQLSAVVARLLVHLDFRARGQRLAEPPDRRAIPVAQMQPMEYYILGAHGNEMHLRHRGEEILCGAFAGRATRPDAFDCEPGCRHQGRVRSSEIPAQTVFMLSCDAFTLADGLVPAEYNVMLNLLNGWTTSVLAPSKHVQGNQGLILLVEALAQSGFSLGEVAQRLNAISRLGETADPAYLVLGDPDLVVHPRQAPAPEASWRISEAGLEIAAKAAGSQVLEITIPHGALKSVLGDAATPALTPLSDELLRADVYFTLGDLPARGEVRLIVFSPRRFETEPLLLRILPAARVDEGEMRTALIHLRQLSALEEIGIGAEAVRPLTEELLGILRAAAGYPRPVELVLGDSMLRNFGLVLDVKLREIRQRALAAVLGVMETTRLWPSQSYSHVYSCMKPVGTGSAGPCPFCANSTFCWSYEDPLTDFPSRHLRICSRCGIISDQPAAPQLEVRVTPRRELTRRRETQTFTLRNLCSRPLGLTCFLQFNQWRQIGIAVEPGLMDFDLAVGEEVETTVEVRCESTLPDDILQMQVYALTDTFGLYLVSQKVIVRSRSNGLKISEEDAADVERTCQ